MSIHSDFADQKATITLQGRFDFTQHKIFREVTQKVLELPDLKIIELNMQGVDYLDSSALGILLLLRDRALPKGLNLRITGCREPILKIFEVANFDKLFTIS
jgi:anti-anti-sigma factor